MAGVNVLSLFAGIGGLDLGLERAGLTVVGQVELDPFCRRVLTKHWPEVPRHDDVRTCVDWWLGEPRPAIDVVAGGFPCQPVSVAGRQRAQADERWLWPAAWAVVRDLRPDWVLLENVPGLLGRGMGDVLGDLAAIGYDAEWDCIPAASVGAPHRRDRVFVVAYSSGEPGRLQPEPQPGGGHTSVSGHDGPNGGLAHATGPRWAGTFSPERPHCEIALACREKVFGGRVKPDRQSWWEVEPAMGRVADGVPNRLDRLKGLGNAVVPQVAEHIGRLVMAAAQ